MEKLNLYHQQADELERLLALNNNDDKGEHIKWIISDLRAGNFESAKANYNNQSDKYTDYPEIKSYLKQIGVAEEIDWKARMQED